MCNFGEKLYKKISINCKFAVEMLLNSVISISHNFNAFYLGI